MTSLFFNWNGDRSTLHGVQSWDEFVDECSQRSSKSGREAGGVSQTVGGGDHYGTNTFTEAIRMAKDGWAAGAQELSDSLDVLAPEAEGRLEWTLDAVGRFPCIPAYLANDPDCMFQQQNTGLQKTIALIVYASYAYSVSGAKALNYAKALAAVVRSLEASGVNTAIYATCAYQTWSQATIVRAFGEPLDLEKVAFCMHPAYFRRLYFAYGELTDERVAAGFGNGGYGGSLAGGYLMPSQEWAEALIGPGTYCVIPPLNDAHVASVAADQQHITTYLHDAVQTRLNALGGGGDGGLR